MTDEGGQFVAWTAFSGAVDADPVGYDQEQDAWSSRMVKLGLVGCSLLVASCVGPRGAVELSRVVSPGQVYDAVLASREAFTARGPVPDAVYVGSHGTALSDDDLQLVCYRTLGEKSDPALSVKWVDAKTLEIAYRNWEITGFSNVARAADPNGSGVVVLLKRL